LGEIAVLIVSITC